jgi:hypothetical protein
LFDGTLTMLATRMSRYSSATLEGFES